MMIVTFGWEFFTTTQQQNKSTADEPVLMGKPGMSWYSNTSGCSTASARSPSPDPQMTARDIIRKKEQEQHRGQLTRDGGAVLGAGKQEVGDRLDLSQGVCMHGCHAMVRHVSASETSPKEASFLLHNSSWRFVGGAGRHGTLIQIGAGVLRCI